MDTAAVLVSLKAWFMARLAESPFPLQFVIINRKEGGVPLGTFGLLLSDSQRGGENWHSEIGDYTIQVVLMGDTMEVDNDKTDKISAWVIDNLWEWEGDWHFNLGNIPQGSAPRMGYQQALNLSPTDPNYGFVERVIGFTMWHTRKLLYP